MAFVRPIVAGESVVRCAFVNSSSTKTIVDEDTTVMITNADRMFIRFVTLQIHHSSHQPQGLFTVAYDLLEEGDLSDAEQLQLRDILNWFKNNLRVPDDFDDKARAVFWYRSSAHEHLKRMWELANLLRSWEYAIELQTCQYLGNIVYNDEHQVAAYPHPRDSKIIIK